MRNLFYNFLICIAVIIISAALRFYLKPESAPIDIIEPSIEEAVSEKSVKTAENNESVKTSEAAAGEAVALEDSEKFSKSVPNQPSQSELVDKEVKTIQTAPAEKTSAAEIAVPANAAEKKEPSRKLPPQKKVEVPAVVEEKTLQKVSRQERKTEADEQPVPEKEYNCVWLEDFMPDGHCNGVKFVDGWKREGGVMFTPKTNFFIRHDPDAEADNVLVIESKKSSAVFGCDLSKIVNLNKTPILRWRWRVKKLPPQADGRKRSRDDQAVGLYIAAGNAFNQKVIAYRWETETPVGHWGKTVYSSVMDVWFYCLRNKDDGIGVWYEETRNIREDFLAKFGYVPENIGIAVCGNSQNSQSDALAEVDYIGFYEEKEAK